MLPSSLPRVLPIALHSLLPEALATVHLPEQKNELEHKDQIEGRRCT